MDSMLRNPVPVRAQRFASFRPVWNPQLIGATCMDRSADSTASAVQARDDASPMTLVSATAADLMVPNPVSIRDSATIGEAIAVLADRGLSAAPVIDAAG